MMLTQTIISIQCTKKCGGGTQKRTVKCFEPSLDTTQMKETDNCKYSERPQGFRNCNTHSCEETTTKSSTRINAVKYDPKVDLIQNDITPGKSFNPYNQTCSAAYLIFLHNFIIYPGSFIFSDCVDKFPNCHIVIRAQLCTYEYYINNCCAACKEATQDLY